MRLQEVSATNVKKTRSIAGRVVKMIMEEIKNLNLKDSGIDAERRHFSVILTAIQQRADKAFMKKVSNRMDSNNARIK